VIGHASTRPALRPGRLGALATGGFLAAAAGAVAVRDPSAEGTWFPGCAFHQLTGLWCPGCGLTRGTHHLLRGDVGAAMGSNLFTPLVLIAVAAAWAAWALHAFDRMPRTRAFVGAVRDRRPAGSSAVLLTLTIAFGVLRNLPMQPFRMLAP
jgi:hypothetical protein